MDYKNIYSTLQIVFCDDGKIYRLIFKEHSRSDFSIFSRTSVFDFTGFWIFSQFRFYRRDGRSSQSPWGDKNRLIYFRKVYYFNIFIFFIYRGLWPPRLWNSKYWNGWFSPIFGCPKILGSFCYWIIYYFLVHKPFVFSLN